MHIHALRVTKVYLFNKNLQYITFSLTLILGAGGDITTPDKLFLQFFHFMPFEVPLSESHPHSHLIKIRRF